MTFEAKVFFALAIFAGACAMVRSHGEAVAFLTASSVTYLAAATAISLYHLTRLVGDRPCR